MKPKQYVPIEKTDLYDSIEKPVRNVVDLNIGERVDVSLANGTTIQVELTKLGEIRNTVCGAVESAVVSIKINGQEKILHSGNYNLPQSVSEIKVDCPITKGYYQDSIEDHWGLAKDARLRLWPADSGFMGTETFIYPLKQPWLSQTTQMSNEPVYGGNVAQVSELMKIYKDGNIPQEELDKFKIYYHSGMDHGGCEGISEVFAVLDGIVVSAGDTSLPGFEDLYPTPRYDRVFVLDKRGWYHLYSHMDKIDKAMQPGKKITAGQRVGVTSKEGTSGGWSHLHFQIDCMQPSGRWGVEDSYAYWWEAYHLQYKPSLLAICRPSRLAYTGETIVLDGSHSYCKSGEIKKFEWSFCDGSHAEGEKVERVYEKPGNYNEIMKITDTEGNSDYNFNRVLVVDKNHMDQRPPSVHSAYHPCFGIKPGDEVLFKVRALGTSVGTNKIDFGDGSPLVYVQSDGKSDKHDPNGYVVATHVYDKAGTYIVGVERDGEHGRVAYVHLKVEVEG